MATKLAGDNTKGLLTSLIVTPGDVVRLRRELATIEDFMHQTSIRRPGQSVALPKVGSLIEGLAKINNINLLDSGDRQELLEFLHHLKTKAPVVHISFSTEPSLLFMGKIVDWFRQNIHSQVLVNVGLQPSIAAGCVVRTPNQVFDFSLRKRLVEKRSLLINRLDESSKT